MDLRPAFTSLNNPNDILELKKILTEISDTLDTLYTTTDPSSNISARQGRICLYNNSGVYKWYINIDGATTWQEISNQTMWQVDGTETQLKTADEIDMQSKKIINVTDPTAAQDASTKTYTDTKISKTTAGEIAAMTEKTTLVDADLFLIEDSAASNAKKKVQKSNVIPGVFGKLISTTTSAGATNTGDITIAASKRYLVTMVITAAGTPEPNVSLRFNSSATATGYAWNGRGTTFTTTPTATEDGDDSDSEISLAKPIASGGYVNQLAVAVDNGFIRGYFYIDTNKVSTAYSAFVTGAFLASAYGNVLTRAEFAGVNKENLTITDFELVFSTNCSFTINLYEID